MRRFARASWPLALLLCALAVRAAGCRKSAVAPGKQPTPPRGFATPLLTPPPHRPTPTMWPGVTRVPDLPE